MMKLKELPIGCVFIIVVLCGLITCGGKKENVKTIGVSVEVTTFPTYTLMRQALMENAGRYDVNILWTDAQSGDKSAKPATREYANIKKMLNKGIDALILNPVDVKIYRIIREARRRKVPVITLDKLPADMLVNGHIMVNARELGRAAAKQAIEVLQLWYPLDNPNDTWNIIVLEGPLGNRKLRGAMLGIYEVLDQYQAFVRVVSSPKLSSIDTAFDSVNTTLVKYAGNIQAVIACRSDLIVGAIRAVKAHGLCCEPGWHTDPEKRKGFAYVRRKGIVTIGVGASEEACKLIFKGEHLIEVDEMPYQRALTAMEVALDIINTKTFQSDGTIPIGRGEVKVKYSPIRVITKDNIRQMEQTWPNIFGK